MMFCERFSQQTRKPVGFALFFGSDPGPRPDLGPDPGSYGDPKPRSISIQRSHTKYQMLSQILNVEYDQLEIQLCMFRVLPQDHVL